MDVILLCPDCGQPAISVNFEAVIYNLVDSVKINIGANSRWSVCKNPKCDSSYFSEELIFKTKDLNKPFYFKDDGDDVPICYCSDLTRGEIKKAVKQGINSIRGIRKHTKKNISGYCKERNPLGQCCRDEFLKTIADQIA